MNNNFECSYQDESGELFQNGFCTAPINFGRCQCNSDNSINCAYFRTTLEFLPIHKSQLETVERCIERAGEEQELEKTMQVATDLRRIIAILEDRTLV